MHKNTGYYSLSWKTWIDLVLVSFFWGFLIGISFFLDDFFCCRFLQPFGSEGVLNPLSTSSIVFWVRTAVAIKWYIESVLWRKGSLQSLDLVRLWDSLLLYVFLDSCFLQFSYCNLISLDFQSCSYFLNDCASLPVSLRLPLVSIVGLWTLWSYYKGITEWMREM